MPDPDDVKQTEKKRSKMGQLKAKLSSKKSRDPVLKKDNDVEIGVEHYDELYATLKAYENLIDTQVAAIEALRTEGKPVRKEQEELAIGEWLYRGVLEEFKEALGSVAPSYSTLKQCEQLLEDQTLKVDAAMKAKEGAPGDIVAQQELLADLEKEYSHALKAFQEARAGQSSKGHIRTAAEKAAQAVKDAARFPKKKLDAYRGKVVERVHRNAGGSTPVASFSASLSGVEDVFDPAKLTAPAQTRPKIERDITFNDHFVKGFADSVAVPKLPTENASDVESASSKNQSKKKQGPKDSNAPKKQRKGKASATSFTETDSLSSGDSTYLPSESSTPGTVTPPQTLGEDDVFQEADYAEMAKRFVRPAQEPVAFPSEAEAPLTPLAIPSTDELRSVAEENQLKRELLLNKPTYLDVGGQIARNDLLLRLSEAQIRNILGAEHEDKLGSLMSERATLMLADIDSKDTSTTPSHSPSTSTVTAEPEEVEPQPAVAVESRSQQSSPNKTSKRGEGSVCNIVSEVDHPNVEHYFLTTDAKELSRGDLRERNKLLIKSSEAVLREILSADNTLISELKSEKKELFDQRDLLSADPKKLTEEAVSKRDALLRNISTVHLQTLFGDNDPIVGQLMGERKALLVAEAPSRVNEASSALGKAHSAEVSEHTNNKLLGVFAVIGMVVVSVVPGLFMSLTHSGREMLKGMWASSLAFFDSVPKAGSAVSNQAGTYPPPAKDALIANGATVPASVRSQQSAHASVHSDSDLRAAVPSDEHSVEGAASMTPGNGASGRA